MYARVILSCFALLFLVPSITALADEAQPELNSAARKKLYDCCFEVVIPRPEKDSLSYEKELPWDLVPFNLRNDKYLSIGTAFAVSETDLVTAFHVLELDKDYKVFNTRLIRDRNNNVYELDQVVALDEARDFVRFSVKGGKFSEWLSLNPVYEMDQKVFTAGNAYGEGVIIRSGSLIGTLPEPENGEWKILKSSADINGGNSGGPLLDKDGNVIGIVLSRKDNICQSLPVAEMQKQKPGVGVFHKKMIYGFALFPETSPASNFQLELGLPMEYREVSRKAAAALNSAYITNMDKLFADNDAEVFPRGKNSQAAILDIPNSPFPEVLFKDSDNRSWGISDLKVKSSELGDNGQVVFASTDDIYYIQLIRPDNVTLAGLIDKPKMVMDMVLKGIQIPRKLANQDIRITSLGEPFDVATQRDKHGRPWQVSRWTIEYCDQIGIAFTSLTPDGVVMLLKFVSSSSMEHWMYDLKKYVDFILVPYKGSLKQWQEFLACSSTLPESVARTELQFQAGKSFRVKNGSFQLEMNGSIVPVEAESELTMNYGLFLRGGRLVWDIRRLLFSEHDKDNYFVILKHIPPPDGMSEEYRKSWADLINGEHPYSGKTFAEDGRTNIGMLFADGKADKKKPAAPNRPVYTFYLGKEGKVSDGALKSALAKLKKGFQVLE